jgi:hypothetical protein
MPEPMIFATKKRIEIVNRILGFESFSLWSKLRHDYLAIHFFNRQNQSKLK